LPERDVDALRASFGAERLLAALLVLLVCHAQSALAWVRQSKDGADVGVWTEAANGKPYLMVRVETEIDAPILRLLPLLQDAPAQKYWLPYTQNVEVLSHPAPEQTRVRFQSKAHWPLSPRDAVTEFVVGQPDEHSVRIEMHNAPDAAPDHPGVTRVRQSEGYWLLTALPGCRTQVRYEAGSNWGGSAPRWLVRRLNIRMAERSLKNLRDWAPAHAAQYTAPAYLRPVPRHADCS
jgi:hypothetical protein